MEPADDEMVFIDFTGDTPSIYFRTEMTRQRTVQLSVGYSSRRVVNHALAKGTERVMPAGCAWHHHQHLHRHLPHGLRGIHGS